MSGKNWITLFAVGGLGLLLGAVIGRQIGVTVQPEQPSQPAEEPAQVANGLTLYGGNADATDIETRLMVTLPNDLAPAAALEQLATVMSRLEFCGLPIELVEIDGDTATINLAEHPWQQDTATPETLPGCAGASWRSWYFQGSAGGLITSKTLTHTLLQPDASGEWIDSITFQYEGQPIAADDWDHLTLSGVISRDRLP
ncbi:MAG: hypothetical protein HC812_00330 [Leptolyngbya sp. RL_3_1]|nr:hypothetical protein [Leptolyngbya sp. RL_3_1]